MAWSDRQMRPPDFLGALLIVAGILGVVLLCVLGWRLKKRLSRWSRKNGQAWLKGKGGLTMKAVLALCVVLFLSIFVLDNPNFFVFFFAWNVLILGGSIYFYIWRESKLPPLEEPVEIKVKPPRVKRTVAERSEESGDRFHLSRYDVLTVSIAIIGCICCAVLGRHFAGAEETVIRGFHPFYVSLPQAFRVMLGLPLAASGAGWLFTLLSSIFFLVIALFLFIGGLRENSEGTWIDLCGLPLSFFYFSTICSITVQIRLFEYYDSLARLLAFLLLLIYCVIFFGCCLLVSENGYWLIRLERLFSALCATAGIAGLTALLVEADLIDTLSLPFVFLRLFVWLGNQMPLGWSGALIMFGIQLLFVALFTAWIFVMFMREPVKGSGYIFAPAAIAFLLIFFSFGTDEAGRVGATKHWIFFLFFALASAIAMARELSLAVPLFVSSFMGISLALGIFTSLVAFEPRMIPVLNRFFVFTQTLRDTLESRFGLRDSVPLGVVYIILLIVFFILLIGVCVSFKVEKGREYSLWTHPLYARTCFMAYQLALMLWSLSGDEQINFIQEVSYFLLFSSIFATFMGICLCGACHEREGCAYHLRGIFWGLVLTPFMIIMAKEVGMIVMSILFIAGGIWLFLEILGGGIPLSGGESKPEESEAKESFAFADAYRPYYGNNDRAILISSVVHEYGNSYATLRDERGNYFTVRPHGQDKLVIDEHNRLWQPDS